MEKYSYAPMPPRLALNYLFSALYKAGGITATIAYFAKLGFPVPVFTAWFITLLEFDRRNRPILGLFVRYFGFFIPSNLSPRDFAQAS